MARSPSPRRDSKIYRDRSQSPAERRRSRSPRRQRQRSPRRSSPDYRPDSRRNDRRRDDRPPRGRDGPRRVDGGGRRPRDDDISDDDIKAESFQDL
jgi:hypothetical protein